MANQRAQRTHGKFFVLRNGQIDPHSLLHQHQMAAHLTSSGPPGF